MMIIPNIAVTDMKTSVDFYMNVFGFTYEFGLLDNHDMVPVEQVANSIFTLLKHGDSELMLQTRQNLSDELPNLDFKMTTQSWGTIYFRNGDVDAVHQRALAGDFDILKSPFKQWYGMYEIYLKDPDGHIICVGERSGDTP